jgi:hypothetical protein
MMIDALTAASIVSDDLSYYRMMDGLRAACARRAYESEIAYQRACNDWLANNLKYVCAEYGKLVDTANGREGEYTQRIADLEQQNAALRTENAHLEGKYRERDAQATEHAETRRQAYNRLVEKHASILECYKTVLMTVPPELFAGNARVFTDYETIRDSGFKPEGS